jgi:hypothetical protein
MPQFVACARSEVKRGSAEHRRIADEILDGLYPTIHGRAAAAVFYDLNGFDSTRPRSTRRSTWWWRWPPATWT